MHASCQRSLTLSTWPACPASSLAASAFPLVWHALVLTPVARLMLRKKNPHALIRNTKGRDPMKIREVIKGFRSCMCPVRRRNYPSSGTLLTAPLDPQGLLIAITTCISQVRHLSRS